MRSLSDPAPERDSAGAKLIKHGSQFASRLRRFSIGAGLAAGIAITANVHVAHAERVVNANEPVLFSDDITNQVQKVRSASAAEPSPKSEIGNAPSLPATASPELDPVPANPMPPVLSASDPNPSSSTKSKKNKSKKKKKKKKAKKKNKKKGKKNAAP